MQIVRFIGEVYLIVIGLWAHIEAWSVPYSEGNAITDTLSGIAMTVSALTICVGAKLILAAVDEHRASTQMSIDELEEE